MHKAECLIKESLYYLSISWLLWSKCKNNKDGNEIAMINEIRWHYMWSFPYYFPHIITFMKHKVLFLWPNAQSDSYDKKC